jgi:hypothetical protein
MLIDTDVWTWIVCTDADNEREINHATVGKWIFTMKLEAIGKVVYKLNDAVESGQIIRAKFTHRKDRWNDPFGDAEPVLIVYADDKTKKEVYDTCIGLGIACQGVQNAVWKYDSETEEDWKPGGKLFIQAMRTRLDMVLGIKRGGAS